MKSLMGVRPDRELIISRKINKGKVLEVVEQLLWGTLCIYEDKIDRLAVQIGDKFDEKEIRAFLESDVE
jgi:hypothetical protein